MNNEIDVATTTTTGHPTTTLSPKDLLALKELEYIKHGGMFPRPGLKTHSILAYI